MLLMQVGNIIAGTGIISRLQCCAWDNTATNHRQKLAKAWIIGGICDGNMESKVGFGSGLASFKTSEHLPVANDDILFLLWRTPYGSKACGFNLNARSEFQKFDN